MSLAYPGLLAGLALLVALVVHHGAREVGAALSVAGGGLAVVALFHLFPMFGDALGWRALLPPEIRPRVTTMLAGRWIGESVNGLLPVMQVGGNVAKARWLGRRGVPGVRAGASVVVDVTLVASTQVLFTLVGLALFVAHVADVGLVAVGALGAAATAALLVCFLVAQRRGAFSVLAGVVARLTGRRHGELDADAAALDADVRGLYRNRAAIAVASGWHLAAWVIGTGEVWLALHFLGHEVPLFTALLLESLGQAVRAGSFIVPGALGVQEGAYVVLGGALGLGPETAMALSLAKRVRELVLGLPGLVAWQLDVVAARVRAVPVSERRSS